MIRKIINGFLNFIVGSCLLTIMAVLGMSFLGIKPYIVISGSMEPEIYTGSLCFINSNVEYTDIREGDIIAFQSVKGSLITHRAIHITEEGIETKGDANDISDGISTTKENYIGKNIYYIPYVGYVLNFFQQKKVKIITITLIIFVILIEFLFTDLLRKNKK